MIVEPLDNDSNPEEQQRRVDAVVAQGPGGAFALAGLALALVMAMWLAFYVIVFVGRGGG